MPATLEGRVQPEGKDLVRQADSHDAGAEREDVGVVVPPRQARREKVVAERRAGARHLVRGHLLTLAAAADDNTAVGTARDDRARNAGADGRVIHRSLAVGAVVVHLVAKTRERRQEVRLQGETRMIGANGNPHMVRLYVGGGMGA
jgi:hypothetical protein